MSDREPVACDRHGSTTPTTFVCRHVACGVACGFWPSTGDPSDRWPDAWCDLCNETFDAGGAVTAQDLRILCTHCWDEARARNEQVPALARGRAARLTTDEQHRFTHGAVHELQAIQDRAQAKWDIGLGMTATKHMRWDLDDVARTLTFSHAGTSRVIADVRMVGSYSTKSCTFQWSWITFGDRAHPLVTGLPELEAFGEVRGIERLTKGSWECDETEGWEMAAVAAALLGAEAAYRAPFDHVFWFMLLSNLRAA